MKTTQMLKIALIVLFLFSGLVGCASKSATPDDGKVYPFDMKKQEQVKGADDSSMQSGAVPGAVPSHDQVAGLERILFNFDQFTLSADARRVLSQNAKFQKANSGVQAVIEGHCDERGSDEYNLALGESRALAAKNYLVSLGINAKRLSVISYGEEKPLRNASNEAAWAQNRRAEFKAVN